MLFVEHIRVTLTIKTTVLCRLKSHRTHFGDALQKMVRRINSAQIWLIYKIVLVFNMIKGLRFHVLIREGINFQLTWGSM